MSIIQTTEIYALELENDKYFEKAERLRQSFSKILSKEINKKHRNNLTTEERQAIRKIKNDAESGFAIMREKVAIKRTEEQIKKSNIKDYDPTTTLLDKFQKELAKLRKEKKVTDTKTYYKVYTLDTISPRVYGVMKAFKPEKNTQ